MVNDRVEDGNRFRAALGMTIVGILRLLTNPAVMGEHPLTLQKSWSVYDRWLAKIRG